MKHPDQGEALTAMRDQIVRTFVVPPIKLGTRPEPKTREDAARQRLVNYEAFGALIPVGDKDAETVKLADGVWRLGMTEEARALLEPLQEPPCPI